MRLRQVVFGGLLALVVTGWGELALAQTNYFFVPAGTATWDSDPNWIDSNNVNAFRPEGGLNETATIDSGGTATVTTTVPAPGSVALGSTRGATTQPLPPTPTGVGTLEVGVGGTLNVVVGTNTSGGINVGVAGTGTLRVLPGGTVTTAGPLTTGANANDVIVVGSAGALLPAATLTPSVTSLNGTTQVFPNAAFSTSGNTNLVFGSTSVYTSEVNSFGTGRISAGGVGVLGGTARLNFTGVSPSLGSTYTVLEADSFAGTFASTSTNVALPSNQKFVPLTVTSSPGRQQIRAKLEEVLVLDVNRDNGLVTMTHPGGAAITLDSYFIGSTAGALVPGSFNGITDKGLLGGNWIETSLTANNIGELKPNLNGSYGAGTQIQLGNIFNPFAGGFAGASEEDLQFVHSRFTDGAVVPAIVNYHGTKVNNLILQVDPTGVENSYLRNTSQTTVNLDIYHVLSPMGRLSPTNWSSLDDQNVDGANTWLEGLNNSANQVSEFNGSVTTPFLTLDPGEKYDMGKLYLGGAQDLVFEFQMQGQGSLTQGRVIYEKFVANLSGDYNADGKVDALDYTVWRNNLNDPTEADINNNGDGANGVDANDFNVWKLHYGETSSGSGGGGLAGGDVVPEPTTCMLALLAGLAACVGVRRSGR